MKLNAVYRLTRILIICVGLTMIFTSSCRSDDSDSNQDDEEIKNGQLIMIEIKERRDSVEIQI